MIYSYRIQPNKTNKRIKQVSTTNSDNSHREHHLKRPQMTSNDIAKSKTNTKSNKRSKNILKGGSMHENIEITAEHIDEILHINNI